MLATLLDVKSSATFWGEQIIKQKYQQHFRKII